MAPRDDNDRDFAQICIRGHVITATTRYGVAEAFCPSCGAKTIDRCESCAALIPGASPMWGGDFKPPAHCGSCGRAFPWTEAGRRAADDVIDLLDGLTPDDREQLKGTLDDLMSDTPQTEVAAIRFKLLARKAGTEGGTALRAIVTSVATEAAKRLILG